MNQGVENGDVSGGNFYMNNHIIPGANNHNTIYYTKKRDGNVPNISEIEDDGFQYSVDIDVMLLASTLHQYASM